MAPFKLPKWAATPSRRRRFAWLEVSKGGERVDELRIGAQACYLLGRNEDACDHGMQHPSISRQHAAILHNRDGDVVVLDLDSAQGTVVNGQEIEPQVPRVLADGDCIVFGASSRKYFVRDLDKSVEEKAAAGATGGVTMEDTAMQELPLSFGGQKKNQMQVLDDKRAVASPAATAAAAVAAARKARQEEIAAMTAAMMAAPAQTPAPNRVMGERAEASPSSASRSVRAQQHQKKEVGSRPAVDGNQEDEKEEEDSSDDDDEGAKDDVAARYNLPISRDVNLSGHSKMLTCIAVDAPGGRVATGSMDYNVKLWDFAGMARHVRPFRAIEADDGYPIVAVSYSPSGDRLLVATGSAQPKVFSREGVEELHFAKGDMYVVEMSNTNGHTHSVTGAAWHPRLRDQMISSSLDGTVRIWSLTGKKMMNKLVNSTVLKVKSKQGKRSAVTACGYNPDGSLVVCGTMDGQVQCFDPRKAYAGAAITIRDAHADGGGDLGISCVRFSPADKRIVASRACSDDTVKLWDVRKTNRALKVFHDMEGIHGSCNVAFNAAGTALVAGTCVRKGHKLSGQVRFFDVHTPGLVTPIAQVSMEEDESAICVEWHHGIQQVLVGSSSNTCRILYDPTMSKKGVLLSATKKLKSSTINYGVSIGGEGEVHNPHALPMFRNEASRKRKFHNVRKDAKMSKAPEKPITGPGVGGKINGSSTFTQYFMSNHIKGSSFREEDPREAILKYAKKAEQDPQFTSRAYATSQPIGKLDQRYQLAAKTVEEEKIAQEEEQRRLLQP